MASLAELARRALERDPYLQMVLAQDLLNARGLAQRIYEEEDSLEKEEKIDSLANAIRRQGKDLDPSAFEHVHEWLSDTKVEATEGLGGIILDRDPDVIKEIERLFRTVEVDRGETFQLLGNQASVAVLLDSARLDEVRNTFDEDAVRGDHEELTSLELVPPDDEGASETVLQAALGSLRANGVRSVFTTASPDGASILVPREKGQEALDVLDGLTQA